MASTKSIIDEIKIKAGNWNRQGSDKSIAAMVNWAQNYLFSKPTRESLAIDPATGKHPLLPTTATIFKYNLPNITKEIYDEDGEAQNVSLRIKIALEIYQEDFTEEGYGLSRVLRQTPSNIVRQVGGRYVVNATPYEARDLQPARAIFHFDPTTTTDKYYIFGLIEPLQITADTIPLFIPANPDAEFALIEGALGRIEYLDYGRSDRLQTFYDVLAPKFWDAYPAATSKNSNAMITPVRNQ